MWRRARCCRKRNFLPAKLVCPRRSRRPSREGLQHLKRSRPASRPMRLSLTLHRRQRRPKAHLTTRKRSSRFGVPPGVRNAARIDRVVHNDRSKHKSQRPRLAPRWQARQRTAPWQRPLPKPTSHIAARAVRVPMVVSVKIVKSARSVTTGSSGWSVRASVLIGRIAARDEIGRAGSAVSAWIARSVSNITQNHSAAVRAAGATVNRIPTRLLRSSPRSSNSSSKAAKTLLERAPQRPGSAAH